MNAFILIGWGLVGWCGTVPPPRPRPSPRRIIAGIIGGILGGLAIYYALGLQGALSNMDFIATAIGAFAAGRAVSDIVELAFGREKA